VEIVSRITAMQRNGQWWAYINGERRGPFPSKDGALQGAVAEAKIHELTGRKAEVSWDDPDDGTPTIYRSPQQR
jgi:hypothetical protein